MGPVNLGKQKRKVGLALGGGAARGLAHIGVLEVLQKEGIPIDMIAGTSAGALIGGLYAFFGDAGQVNQLFVKTFSHRPTLLAYLTVPRTGLLNSKRVETQLRRIFGDVQFSDLKLPFSCVATNIETGDEIVIKGGPVVDGIMASICLPVIFEAVRCDEMYLVDGSLVDPVPVSVAREMGADFTIAVNVVPDMKSRHRHAEEEKGKKPREPNIFNVIMNTIYISNYRLVRASLEEADIVIEPHLDYIGGGEFHRVQECILEGEKAAQAAIPEIKRKL